MTDPIEMHYPKTLLLQNVVHARAQTNDPALFHQTAVGLDRFIRSRGAAPVGPLVQVTSVDGNSRNTGLELLRQASLPIEAEPGRYAVSPAVEVRGCLLARFRGDVAHLHIVYSKFAVHSYENDLPLAGRFYAVLAEQEGSALAADVFAVIAQE